MTCGDSYRCEEQGAFFVCTESLERERLRERFGEFAAFGIARMSDLRGGDGLCGGGALLCDSSPFGGVSREV